LTFGALIISLFMALSLLMDLMVPVSEMKLFLLMAFVWKEWCRDFSNYRITIL